MFPCVFFGGGGLYDIVSYCMMCPTSQDGMMSNLNLCPCVPLHHYCTLLYWIFIVCSELRHRSTLRLFFFC